MKNIKNFKIEYVVLSVLIVGLILISVSFFKQLNFSDNSQQIEKGTKVELIAGDILEQKFIAQHNGLSNIKILFGNRKLLDGSYIKLVLADKNCKNNIFEKTLEEEYNFDSKYLYDFSFPKIKNSKDKQYCLKIELKTEKKWSLWRKVKNKIRKNKIHKKCKIRLFEQIHNNDGIGNYVVIDKSGKIKVQGKGGVVFRQSYRAVSVGKSFQQLSQRMSQYKPWFLKGNYLTVIFWLAVILSLISFRIIMRYKR